MKLLRVAVVGLGLAGIAGPALAQMDSREAIDLQNQILALRRDMQQLQQSGGGGGAAPAPLPLQPSGGNGGSSGDLTPQLLDRVSQLEDQVRQLRGRLDESDNARQRQMDDLSKRIGDLEFKAGISPPPPSGGGAPPLPTGQLTPPPGVAPAPPAARRTPEIALQDGAMALNRHDYAAAEGFAREVLATGHGPRTTDAQYLLAQALAGKRDYAGAAVAFDDSYTRNPKGGRAPDSLLGLANSLSAINERKAACQTLAKLRVEFPALRPDLRPLAAAARQRAGCA